MEAETPVKVEPVLPAVKPQPEVSSEDIEEASEQMNVNEEVKPVKNIPSMHSDMVNMVVDLFDGKFIE